MGSRRSPNPRASPNVRFREETLDRLVDQFTSFVKDNSFDISARQTRPEKWLVIIEMTRSDTKLAALEWFRSEAHDVFVYTRATSEFESRERSNL